ncbi:MAG: hypothetical protein ACI8YC_000674 [Salibacteraceae bacterium]|jgi:hypothetical protein
MKSITKLVLTIVFINLLSSACSNKKPELAKQTDSFYTIVGPRMYDIDFSGSGYLDSKKWIWTEREDYIPTLTDTSNWATVLSQTDCIKFYSILVNKYDNKTRQVLADLVQKTGLEVLVEVGGSRLAGGILENGKLAGEMAAKHDQKQLQKWLDTPGAQLDAITTDHAMMWYVREMRPEQIELLIQEHLDYIEAMQKWKPGLKVGFIESLGYFEFDDTYKTYKQHDKQLPHFEFRTFMTQLVTEANKRGIKIDHFDIDFGFRGVNMDTYGLEFKYDQWCGAEKPDYGRILKAEKICRELGLNVGVIFNDLFPDTPFEEKYGGKFHEYDSPQEAERACAQRNIAFIKAYFEAGGHPKRLIFQSWTMNPTRTGPESDSNSFFGITRRQLDAVSQFLLEK